MSVPGDGHEVSDMHFRLHLRSLLACTHQQLGHGFALAVAGRSPRPCLAGFDDLPLDLQWWHACRLGFQTWKTSSFNKMITLRRTVKVAYSFKKKKKKKGRYVGWPGETDGSCGQWECLSLLILVLRLILFTQLLAWYQNPFHCLFSTQNFCLKPLDNLFLSCLFIYHPPPPPPNLLPPYLLSQANSFFWLLLLMYFKIFNWRTVALQYYACLCCAAMWISHNFPSLSESPTHRSPTTLYFHISTEHWAELPCFTVISHDLAFTHGRVYISEFCQSLPHQKSALRALLLSC